MAEEVNVPGIGKTKTVYVLGGVAVVVVAAIIYYRSHSSSSAASTTAAAPGAGTPTTSDPYPSDGSVGNASDPNSVDPATGVTYGDESIGFNPQTGSYGSNLGGYGGYYDSGQSGIPPTNPNSGPGTFTDNADWSQYAINYLIQTSGMDAGTVTNALGLYIQGQQVTASQEQIINSAIAIAGTPPVSGPGGYPPSIRLSGSKQGTQVKVPNVVGKDIEQASQILTSAGLTVHGVAGVPNVLHVVTKQTPAAGKLVAEGTLVTLQYKSETEHTKTSNVKVPSLIGKDVVTASHDCGAVGLSMTPEPKATKGRTHIVTNQNPKAGTEVKKGSAVHIAYKTQ